MIFTNRNCLCALRSYNAFAALLSTPYFAPDECQTHLSYAAGWAAAAPFGENLSLFLWRSPRRTQNWNNSLKPNSNKKLDTQELFHSSSSRGENLTFLAFPHKHRKWKHFIGFCKPSKNRWQTGEIVAISALKKFLAVLAKDKWCERTHFKKCATVEKVTNSVRVFCQTQCEGYILLCAQTFDNFGKKWGLCWNVSAQLEVF